MEYVDLKYDEIDYNIYRFVKIHPETKKPAIERIHPKLTPEEKMRELEDQILLLANEKYRRDFVMVNEVVVRIAAERILNET
ncbi:hypothetical protein [Paenibacillus sp. 2KB_22]|uniref:hypothetical protein n=1 Tax=Paenibacillus sp. 2KB_22 TaxID=3232978 RepID=UPI003F99F6F9